MQSEIVGKTNRRLTTPKAEALKKNKLKDERPTSNIERPTSNNDVAPLFKLF